MDFKKEKAASAIGFEVSLLTITKWIGREFNCEKLLPRFVSQSIMVDTEAKKQSTSLDEEGTWELGISTQ